MRTVLWGLALAIFLGAPGALAQAPPPDPAQLDYTLPAATACPDEDYFRAYVSGRLGGQDPFTPQAPKRITVAVERKPGRFVVKLDMWDQAGVRLGRQEPDLADADCTKLVERAGLVVAGWLVPLVGPRRRPPASPAQPPATPPPAPKRAEAPECPKPPPPVVAPPESAPAREPDPGPPDAWVPPEPLPGLGFRAGVNVLAENYATGVFSIGFAVDAGIRYRWFSIAVEGRVDPPLGPPPSPGIPLSFARVVGGMLACLHHDIFMACGIGQAGRIVFPVAPEPEAAKSYYAAGIRVGALFPTGDPRFFIQAAGEVLAAIDRKSLRYAGQSVYETASTNGGLVVGLVFAQ